MVFMKKKRYCYIKHLTPIPYAAPIVRGRESDSGQCMAGNPYLPKYTL